MTTKTSTMVRLRVLGPVEGLLDGEPVGLGGPKQKAVLATLLTGRGRPVSRDVIIEGVWGEDTSEGNRHLLHTYLSNLRAVLGDVIVRTGDTYRLEVPVEAVDAWLFEREVEGARTQVVTDPVAAAVRLRETLGLWRGLPFADLLDVPGLQSEIRRLEELRLEAVEVRIDAELASGRHEAVVAEVGALAEEHPTRERFRAQQMLALYRSGRQADALSAYRRTERFLAEELGLEPSAELQSLELAILQQDESLLIASDRAVTQRLAFLVTDIEGSTRLWDRHPQEMAAVLATHDRVLREAIESAGGRVFKHTGDGVLAVFGDAQGAAEAAEVAQRAVASADWGEVGEIRVRMGIDVGDAESRGGDFYGPPLNRASRIAAVGHGGQVLVSTSAHAEITAASPAGVQVRQLGEHSLRGLASPERIAQLIFVGLPAEFPPLRLEAEPVLDARLHAASLPGYELRERIGEGAYGVVYRAYQPSVGREVAIKVIRPELADHPSFVRRFEAEARTIARLAHPHIVPLIDFWRDPQGVYLVLQILPGGSLLGALDGDVDLAAKRRILGHVGAALDYAHSQGIVHGDLKPANVLLDGSGNAYLSDFGILPRLLDPELAASLSSAPEFRAPEEATTGPTPEADLFAYGVLISRLMGEGPEIDAVAARATAVTPQDRYPTAAALLADLDEVLGELIADVETPAAVSRNPYKGLRAFEEGDAADFYGREELVETLTRAIAEHRFVAVVGPSGSGKSSAVQAGLLPVLAKGAVAGSQDWFRTVMTPGDSPLSALAEALEQIATEPVRPEELESVGLDAMVDYDLVLVVDQFEELFTLVDDPDQRDRFVELLATTGEANDSRVRVVATLRADFYDRPLEDERLGRLVRDGLVTVLPPTREELVEMITAPAQAVGLRFEPGLAHRIVEDVAHQPGGLPLLQYALTELVERRGADLLTGSDYERIGGVAGALATRAEALYQDLTPVRQEAARQILLRLVTVDEETDDTRRRVRRSELESVGIPRSDLDTVLDKFIGDRLLLADRDPTTRGPTVEVAHEALLREWPRLAGWIDDQRESLILGRRFRAALADWEANDRHHDHLLTGHRLAPFTGWAETTTLTDEEQEYYQASQSKDQAERAARRRRRRTLTGILAGAVVVASTLGIIAAVQANRATTEAELAQAERDRAVLAERLAETEAERATEQADLAEQSARVARARELAAAAEAAIATDPALAKLLAIASAQYAPPTLDTVSVLHRTFAADRVVDRYHWPEEHQVVHLSTDLHPDGTRLVASGQWSATASHLEVYDFESGEVVWSWDTPEPDIVIDRPFFISDGAKVVAGLDWLEEDPPPTHLLGLMVWDAETGTVLDRFELGRCGGAVAAVSDRYALVGVNLDVCGDRPVGLELVDIESGERQPIASDVEWPWMSMSGDGSVIAFTEWEVGGRTTVVLDVSTGERLLELDPDEHPGPTWGYVQVLNYDGSLLVAGDRPMAVWDVVSGQRIAYFSGHLGEATAYAFSTDGELVYSVGREGTLLLWSARIGAEIATFPAVGGGRASVADDGAVLVSDENTRRASLLDTAPRGEVWGIPTCGGFVISGTLQAVGDHALVSELCPDGDLVTFVIDLEERELAYTLPGHHGQDLAVSPDGTRFVRQEVGERPDGLPEPVGAENWVGPPRIRDLFTGDLLVELEGVCTWDGFSFAEAEARPGCAAYPEPPFPMFNWQMTWSPDSDLIAVTEGGPGGQQVGVWDAGSGATVLATETCPRSAVNAIFTPDGSELVYSCWQEGWLVAVSTETWEETRLVDLDPSVEGREFMHLIGYTGDASTLLSVGGAFGMGGGSLHWLDANTLEPIHTIAHIHDGSPKSFAMSPDRSLVATGSSDGFVKVWDVVERRLYQEIYVGPAQVQGLAFIDDLHLAVAPQTGGMIVYTLDPDELVEIVRGSLTRGFTPAECARFDFGDECPTLEKLQSRE